MKVINLIQYIWKMEDGKWKMYPILFMILLVTVSAYPQNIKVSWSVFNSGFNFSKNANVGIMSEAGQNFTGISKNSNIKVTSGFFANYSSIITGVNDNKEAIPKKFELSQNYPNPFNPTTRIEYSISSKQFVTLKVYDILGREVTTLVNEEKSAGSYEVTFNAGNLASGVYIYTIKAGAFYQTKKLILLK